MLQKAANYANSRLHAVNAQVLVLARFVKYLDPHLNNVWCYETPEMW